MHNSIIIFSGLFAPAIAATDMTDQTFRSLVTMVGAVVLLVLGLFLYRRLPPAAAERPSAWWHDDLGACWAIILLGFVVGSIMRVAVFGVRAQRALEPSLIAANANALVASVVMRLAAGKDTDTELPDSPTRP